MFPATLANVSPRTRVLAATSVIAAVAAGAIVVIAASWGGEPPSRVRDGLPPLTLDLGVRTDPEARDLRRALELYDDGHVTRARAIFSRRESVEALVGRQLVAWPRGTIDGLQSLSRAHPRSALVQLELGLALLWAGEGGAEEAWRRAAALQPDTTYAITAGSLLYPRYAPKLPIFVPTAQPPAALEGKTPPQQLALLAHGARSGSAQAKLLYGVALQRLGRPVSARRVFDAAVRQAPNDAEALVAAAVARFDKKNPSAAFSRLGPLTRRFPEVASVRFHLGLLLLWIGSVDQAKTQLRLATTAQPGSTLARAAAQYLRTLR
jgi:tetratricopeptide (TPR) repeat protein